MEDGFGVGFDFCGAGEEEGWGEGVDVVVVGVFVVVGCGWGVREVGGEALEAGLSAGHFERLRLWIWCSWREN